MATKKERQCRYCHQKFDVNNTVEGVDWIMPSKGWYYHPSCYIEWQSKKNDVKAVADDEVWFNSLKDFLAKDVRMSINYPKLTAQWKSLIKDGRTAKGIYFAAKYYFDVKHGSSDKSDGGIGIIPYIYEESATYWINREHQQHGIIASIEQQALAIEKRKVIEVKAAAPVKKKKVVDLSIIADMPEDEEC